MSDKPPSDSSETATPPNSKGTFKYFQRRPKTERAPSGRVLPPPPAWMLKPLKPPRARPSGNDS